MYLQKTIENKRNDLLDVFSGLSEKELRVAADLIDQAAFMAATLEDLAATISENGTVEEYTNGANQSGRKISSEAKLYSSLIAKYTAVITKLLQLIPEEKKPERIQPKQTKEKPENSQAVADLERQREKEAAFFDAIKRGEVKQTEYKAFCAAWEKEHA